RVYFAHLGLSRERLLETLRPGADPWDADRVAESLGMSPREYRIVAGQQPDPPNSAPSLAAYYGYDVDPAWQQKIAAAPEIENRTGIAFADLVDLVKTWFVNREQADENLRIALQSPGECDPSSTTITKLDNGPLDRIHRFLRLWRRLAWPIADLDRALFALVASDLDPTAVRKLAQLRLIRSDLNLSLAEALALWAPIDTWGRDALYLKLFQNRAVAGLG